VTNAYSVLVVDDEPSIGKLLKKELSSPARAVQTAESAHQAREMLRRTIYEVVVLDLRLPDADGLDLLVEIRQYQPDVEVIIITGHGNIDSAVEAMKLGAHDYITKPFNLEELELIVERAYQRVCLRFENRQLRHAQVRDKPQQIVGNSAAVKQIRFLIDKVAPTDVPVLITGESGAGKEVAATAIQARSKRADKPYVIKNCATLQKELARSELFGYVKGSFTGATENREGLMTFANKGTMFLDEIGELPLEVQASLLRTLENKTYRRVGDKDERTTDIRLVFATNRNLAKEVEAGRFHEALYHRINVFNIELPPLRERKEDIPLLVDYFLGRIQGGSYRISDRAMSCLINYQWPGNIRELRNVIERGVILSEAGVITENALPRELSVKVEGENDFLSLEAVEREHIAKVLACFGNNRTLAAGALGISRKTLYRKIREYGIM
jgi:two-component system, NtrC family, response regulator